MAQSGFILEVDGKSVGVLNDSTTSAITAGDLCYSIANNDVVTGTAASVRAGYARGDIRAKAARWSATGYQKPIGVAEMDIPASGYGTVALEGIFCHAAEGNIEAGEAVKIATTTANRLEYAWANSTASAMTTYKIGRALTGGTAKGKFIIWKLSL
jgi:hypothetical protein